MQPPKMLKKKQTAFNPICQCVIVAILTKGFIPHMTISEAGREPEAVQSINEI